MPNSTATVSTPHASRYLQQMCKHFAHKVPVEFTSNAGHVSLPFGRCGFAAIQDTLTLTATAENTDLSRVENVISDHLARFAFREKLTLRWQRVA